MKKDADAPKGDNKNAHGKDTTKDTPRKCELSLFTVLSSGKSGVIQPEAARVYGESCLHSSISTMRNEYGLIILGKPEKYQHRHGGHTHFHRYRFASYQAGLKGLEVLNHLRKRRGRAPLALHNLVTLDYMAFEKWTLDAKD